MLKVFDALAHTRKAKNVETLFSLCVPVVLRKERDIEVCDAVVCKTTAWLILPVAYACFKG